MIYGNDRSDHRLPGIRKDYFSEKYAEYLMDQGLHIGILEMISVPSTWIC